MTIELLVLRFIHIIGGIVWVGSSLFSVLFLGPALVKAGPGAAGQVMQGLQQRKLFTWLPIVAVLTILAGARLMVLVSGGQPGWFQTNSGRTYSISAMLAIIAFLLFMFVSRPASAKAVKLAQSVATDEHKRVTMLEQVKRLQRRSVFANTVTAFLLFVAALGMSIARYV